jgi:Ca-activated chloride channel family protein
MRIDPNDARLTALALNELSEDERKEVEALLAASPEAQAAVDEIRELAGLLTAGLGVEPTMTLTRSQRERLEAELSTASGASDYRRIPFNDRAWQVPMAIAASIVLVLGVVAWQTTLPRSTPASQLAQIEKDPQAAMTRDTRSSDELGRQGQVVALANPDGDGDGDGYPDAAIGDGFEDKSSGLDRAGEGELSPSFGRPDNRMAYGQVGGKEAASSREAEVAAQRALIEAAERERQLEIRQLYEAYLRSHPEVAVSNANDAGEPHHQLLKYPESWLEIIGKDKQNDAPQGQDTSQVFEVAGCTGKQLITYSEAQGSLVDGNKSTSSDGNSNDDVPLGQGDDLVDYFASNKGSKNVVYLNSDNRDTSEFEAGVPGLESVGIMMLVDRAADSKGYTITPYGGLSENEAYAPITENHFLPVMQNPLSTFSIDVDTASYANVRRFLNQNTLPPPNAVRVEELINYFTYDYPEPGNLDDPFSVNIEVADCPWNTEHLLARIGLQGYEIPASERPASNLVFLLDVSGSMQPHNKLPLVKEALTLLINELDSYDRVAIVVYAGSSGLALPSTTCNNKQTILNALNNLSAGGSTNGAAGIQLAYDVASENFIPDGVNRVILATDGDFNVGITDRSDLTSLITERAADGIFLSVLGFGMGNLKDATMEQLADRGNGNYAYIDNIAEAEKVLVDQISGTLVTIAKDVKIQVEFNPAMVAAYRLIGYENRALAARDFNDDAKDAGEIGAGHSVTALYELVPAGEEFRGDEGFEEVADGEDLPAAEPGEGIADADGVRDDSGAEYVEGAEVANGDIENIDGAQPQTPAPSVDPLKYQPDIAPSKADPSNELMTVKLRFKPHDGDKSILMEVPYVDAGTTLNEASKDFHFAASVTAFGMLLRGSQHKGNATWDMVQDLADAGMIQGDIDRTEYVKLVEKAASLDRHQENQQAPESNN